MLMTPSLHKPVPMGTRVLMKEELTGKEESGRVVGIATMSMIFQYIVLLDNPHECEYGSIEAVAVPGSMLINEETGRSYRLND